MTLPTEMGRLGLVLDADGFVRAGQKARTELGAIGKAAEETGARVDGVAASFDSASVLMSVFSRGAGSLGLAYAAAEVMQYAGAWEEVDRRLKVTLASTDNLRVTQRDLLRIAREGHVSYTEAAEDYMRMAQGLKGLGVSQVTAVTALDAFSKMLVISSANTKLTETTLATLTKGMGAGALSAEEFTSVVAAMPSLLGVLASSLGTSTSAVEDLGRQGRITTSILLTASQKALPELTKEAAKVAPTVAQSLAMIRDRMMSFVVGADQATGASKGLALTLKAIADNFDLILADVSSNFSPVLASFVMWRKASEDNMRQSDKEADAQRRLQQAYQATAMTMISTMNATELYRARNIERSLDLGGTEAADRTRKGYERADQVVSRAGALWSAYVSDPKTRKQALDAGDAQRTFSQALAEGSHAALAFMSAAEQVVTVQARLEEKTDKANKRLKEQEEALTKQRRASERFMEGRAKFDESSETLTLNNEKLKAFIAGNEQLVKTLADQEEFRKRLKTLSHGLSELDTVILAAILRQNVALERQAAIVGVKRKEEQETINEFWQAQEKNAETQARRELAMAAERERQLRQPWENAMRSVQATVASTFEKLLANELRTWEDFGDAIVGIFRRVAAEAAATLAMQGIQDLLRLALSGMRGGAFGAAKNYAPDQFLTGAGVAHSGGVVGAAGMAMRQVPSAVFVGARRFHGGGLVLGSDEVPIIAQRGERILPKGDSGKGAINVAQHISFELNVLDASSADQVIERSAPTILRVVGDAASRVPGYRAMLTGR